ncbi:MAG: magnesium and cobalt transport protein CorA [Alphaproteobacteria bacterium]|nr:magnesium and cobalt transport protein CorA [Alphaproteobacteria bacterium]MBF0128557.1 magnesium and cobalt transport protein CorA [Alphaproteobacteria bacterium]
MSLHDITDVLTRQKIVESVSSAQTTRRQDLVGSVVQRQHSAELQAILARTPASEIGRTLDSLSAEDAKRLWAQIGPERQDDILWETSDALGEELAGERELRFLEGQISAFELIDGRVQVINIASRKDFENIRPIWIDVLGASRSERNWIARRYGLDLPDPDELTDLEVSARFYVEETDEVHLHSNFLLDREGDIRSVPVAFIVHGEILFSLRNEELPVFRLQRLRARNRPGALSDCKDLLLEMYSTDVEYSADSLEDTYSTLRRVGQEVLSETVSDANAARILSDIAAEEDLNGRIRGNMLDTQRAVSFLIRGKFLSEPQTEAAREIMRDIESLNSHTSFLFDKINFLMDAIVGFININQNKRVSQLTVAGVVFMPLNVIAGIGGMSEFSMMTRDIPWPVSYGSFIAVMGMVGWATYVALRALENRKARGNPATARLRKSG